MRITEGLAGKLRQAARLRGVPESDIMREAIAEKVDEILQHPARTAWDDAREIIEELGLNELRPRTDETFSRDTGRMFGAAMVDKHERSDR